MARSRWRVLVERLLPWYSPETELQRDAHTEEIRQRSISARIRIERVAPGSRMTNSYREADRVVRRER